MEKFICQNIKHLRELKKLSQEDFATQIGKKRSVVGSYEKGEAEPSVDIIMNIAEIFGIKIEDFITKDLKNVAILSQSPEWLSSATKLYPKNINTDINLSSEVALQVLEGEGLVGRRVYISPEPAMASYPSSYTGEGGGGLEYFYMPFLAAKGFYACFLVQGKSMEEYILEGSWVVCRLLEESQQIRSGNLHLIATQSEGLLLKRVRKEPKIKNEGIICYSDNPQYLPFIVPHEDIIKVWVVEMFLQKEFPFLSERANKNLENFLDEL